MGTPRSCSRYDRTISTSPDASGQWYIFSNKPAWHIPVASPYRAGDAYSDLVGGWRQLSGVRVSRHTTMGALAQIADYGHPSWWSPSRHHAARRQRMEAWRRLADWRSRRARRQLEDLVMRHAHRRPEERTREKRWSCFTANSTSTPGLMLGNTST